MAQEGTLAPDSHRLARAHRSGLRPTSPWLWPAAACLGLALMLHGSGAARFEVWRAAWTAGIAAGDAAPLGGAMIGGLAALHGWAAALALVVAIVRSSGCPIGTPTMNNVPAGVAECAHFP